jgi:arginine-tRNA-protein transferase
MIPPMTVPFDVLELYRFQMPPSSCSYLPWEQSSLEYRVLAYVTDSAFEEMLNRGWRRHGRNFFRPACPSCRKCQSLRVEVNAFRPTKSQRRAMKKNADIRLEVGPADVTRQHVRLYNAWHADMHVRSGWRDDRITAETYAEVFLAGNWPFAKEFRYYREDKLVGVGLVDVLPDSLSSVYFYHDPAWRDDSPGTFTVQKEIEYAQQTGRRYLYLGYWIAECPSMAYKNRFGPHDVLNEYPQEHEEPRWMPAGQAPEPKTEN